MRKLRTRLTVRETDLPRVERLLHPLLAGTTVAAVVISVAAILALITPATWPDNADGPVPDHLITAGASLALLATLLGLRKLSQRLPISDTVNLLLGGFTLAITLDIPPGALAAGPGLIAYALPISAAALLLTPGAGVIWATIATLAALGRILVAVAVRGLSFNPVIFAGSMFFLYLLAILNSRVVWWYMFKTWPHMKDEALSVQKDGLLSLPIPEASDDLRLEIEKLAEEACQMDRQDMHLEKLLDIEWRLNNCVMEAYSLSRKEVETINATLPMRDPLHILQKRVRMDLEDG